MNWAKIDDGFYDHPKVLVAGEEAANLYLRGLVWCCKHLTDGAIPREALRTIPIPRAAADLAREMVAWRDSATGGNGKPIALGTHWVLDRLARAWEAARLPGDPPGMHDCRRTYATELSRTAGVSVRDVQRLLGHADLKTTERYLGRYRTDAARAAVDLGVSAALSGPAAPVLPLRRRAVP